ncbi:MAG: ParA family protein [Planctomycetota bacterium]|nr:ParA family protein [Planctomycetota bacterium]
MVLANQKGGVGKTTTAIHLAHGLAIAGSRVALFDLDPQGNATVAIQAMTCDGDSSGMPDVFTRVTPTLWLLGASGAATKQGQASVDLRSLTFLVDSIRNCIDWLVVDCPPRLEGWGWAGLQLCDQVLVPVQAEFFAMHGLSQMLDSLKVAASSFPGKAAMRGILPTMVDLREPVAAEVLADLRTNLGELVMDSIIVRDSNLIEAASHGKTVFEHCPWAKSCMCYTELVKEIIDG